MKLKAFRIALVVAALGLIGYGAWCVYPPAGPLSVGLLVWLDLTGWGWLEMLRPRGGRKA